MMRTRTLQARLASLGFNPGPIDGIKGRRTLAAREDAYDRFGVRTERGLLGPAGLARIHWHWTAGAYGVIGMERRAYNILINRDGSEAPGLFPIEAQANYKVGKAASHTRHCNDRAVGVSIDAMAGAQERPFSAGSAPVTWDQVHGLVRVTARICEAEWIPVSKYSTLSHSEVQPTLGVRQRWKWDINWLPDMDQPGDPIEVGERLREMVRDLLDESGTMPEAEQSAPVRYQER